jgi:hypothetical protein
VGGIDIVKVSSSGKSVFSDTLPFSAGRGDTTPLCESSEVGDAVDEWSENMNHVNPAKRVDEMKNKDVNSANAMMR